MVVDDVNGGKLWFGANEMWLCGCQSRVAILRENGSARRAFMGVDIVRPEGTASEPFWMGVRNGVLLEGYGWLGLMCGDGWGRTGGQKSSWKSTTMRAGLKGLLAMVGGFAGYLGGF